MAEVSRENNEGVLPEAVVIEAARFAAAGIARRLRHRQRTDASQTLGDLQRVLGAERGSHAVNVALAELSSPDRHPGETRRGYALRRFLNIVRPAPDHVFGSLVDDYCIENVVKTIREIVPSGSTNSSVPTEVCCDDAYVDDHNSTIAYDTDGPAHSCETSRRWDEERPAAIRRLVERFVDTNAT